MTTVTAQDLAVALRVMEWAEKAKDCPISIVDLIFAKVAIGTALKQLNVGVKND